MILALAAGAAAKLVIVNADQPPAVIPYVTLERCERARDELTRQAHDPQAGKVEQVPGGGVMLHGPDRLKAYCIPS